MKRYLAFGCDRFYPSGGWADLLKECDSLPEAEKECREWKPATAYGEAHVVDTHSSEVVYREEKSPED